MKTGAQGSPLRLPEANGQCPGPLNLKIDT